MPQSVSYRPSLPSFCTNCWVFLNIVGKHSFPDKADVGMGSKIIENETGFSSEEIDEILLAELEMEGVIGPDYDPASLCDKQKIMESSAALHTAFVIAVEEARAMDTDPDDLVAARKIIKDLNLRNCRPN
jgi:hypothetical protein